MSKFKIGDKVKCIDPIYSDTWGVGEMLVKHVEELYSQRHSFHCLHPVKGLGGFSECDLQLAIEEKPASLQEQKQKLLKQIEQIDKQIADKKLEEQKKLGEKEVEIKLTLLELAWIVADVGNSNDHITRKRMQQNPTFVSRNQKFSYPRDNEHLKLYDRIRNILTEHVD